MNLHTRAPTEAATEKQIRRVRTALSRSGAQTALLVLSDLVAIALSPFIAAPITLAIKRVANIPPYTIPADTFSAVLLATTIGSAVMAIWLGSKGHYRVTVPLSHEMRDLLAACMTAFFVTGFAFFAIKDDVSRLLVGSSWVSALVLLLISRQIVRMTRSAVGANLRRCTLVSSRSRQARFGDWLARHRDLGLSTDRVIDLRAAEALIDTGTDREIMKLLLGDGVNRRELLICPSARDHHIGLKLARRLTRMGLPYAFLPELSSVPAENVDIQTFAPDDMVAFVTRVNLERPTALALKRFVDIALSAGGLIFLLPVLIPVMVCVKLDGGPLLFGHARVGRGRQIFKCWKFRTMVVDADQKLEDLLNSDPEAAAEWSRDRKLSKDPRITAAGGFLRKSSLDELPQLFNVLRGDMSLVGPRPVVLDELERYKEEAETYLKVRPGLTGLWQVNGRNSTTYEERIRLDEYYVRNWTLWRDFVILVKTIPEVFGKGGR